jgi:putative tryptophan/tyrosine transport system substrate-binding protein
MKSRRAFITLLGGAATAWPLAARAQQGERMRRIAMLAPSFAQTDREGQARIAAFLDTLRRLGWVEGRNVEIAYRFGAGEPDRGKAAAEELVRSAPDVLVGVTNSAMAELQRLTSTIPVVFLQVGDPVDSGFVASLARPGGNITGFQSIPRSMGGKWLGVLKEAAPNTSRAAVLFGSDVANNVAMLHAAETGAPALGVQLTTVDVLGDVEIERAIATFAGEPDGGLIVVPHPYTVANRGLIFSLAARYRLPAVYPDRYFAIEGGLLSYGPVQIDQWRGAATYVDRILRGEKPSELPVQGPIKFELVVNLKTARALGINIPPAFPLRADEVIE